MYFVFKLLAVTIYLKFNNNATLIKFVAYAITKVTMNGGNCYKTDQITFGIENVFNGENMKVEIRF